MTTFGAEIVREELGVPRKPAGGIGRNVESDGQNRDRFEVLDAGHSRHRLFHQKNTTSERSISPGTTQTAGGRFGYLRYLYTGYSRSFESPT